MINNFEKIDKIIFPDGNDVVYHISIIQRKKDGHTSDKTITDFFVENKVYWKFVKPGIIALCQTYQARAYINLNPKSQKQVLFKMADTVLDSMKTERWKPLSILKHSCWLAHPTKDNKIWVIDVDDKDVNLQDIIDNVNSCTSEYNRQNVIDVLPTVNGYHILTRPFSVNKYTDKWEIKKNSLTLVAFYD